MRAVLQELEPSFDNPVAFGFFNLPLEFPMSYHNKTDLTILGSPSERNKAPFDLPLIFRFPRSKTPAILPKKPRRCQALQPSSVSAGGSFGENGFVENRNRHNAEAGSRQCLRAHYEVNQRGVVAGQEPRAKIDEHRHELYDRDLILRRHLPPALLPIKLEDQVILQVDGFSLGG